MALETFHDNGRLGSALQTTVESEFHNACFTGNLEVVKTFVTNGYDVNTTIKYDMLYSPGSAFYVIFDMNGFHFACMGGNLNIVQYFFEHFQIESIREHPLHPPREFILATRSKNIDLVKYLLNMNSQNEMTPQHFNELLKIACEEHNIEMAKFFLQHGADINYGFLSACASKIQNLECMQWMLKQGVDINATFLVLERNAFHMACAEGTLKLVKFLIQNGIDFKKRDYEGKTGFVFACERGRFNLVLFLLPYEFDLNFMNKNGEILVEYLIRDIRWKSKHRLKSYLGIILILMEHGAQVRPSSVTSDERLIPLIKHRIVKITIIKDKIFEIFTGRIAQVITDFAMLPITSSSLENLTRLISNPESSSSEE